MRIPNAISGNTFQNTIWLDNEIDEENKVTFTNYGGSRADEDEWGIAFNRPLEIIAYMILVPFAASNIWGML